MLVTLPAGPAAVTLANVGTVTAYFGAGTAVTTSNGFPLVTAGYPVSVAGYPGGGAVPLSVITAGGSAPVAYVISTASGGTGR